MTELDECIFKREALNYLLALIVFFQASTWCKYVFVDSSEVLKCIYQKEKHVVGVYILVDWCIYMIMM